MLKITAHAFDRAFERYAISDTDFLRMIREAEENNALEWVGYQAYRFTAVKADGSQQSVEIVIENQTVITVTPLSSRLTAKQRIIAEMRAQGLELTDAGFAYIEDRLRALKGEFGEVSDGLRGVVAIRVRGRRFVMRVYLEFGFYIWCRVMFYRDTAPAREILHDISGVFLNLMPEHFAAQNILKQERAHAAMNRKQRKNTKKVYRNMENLEGVFALRNTVETSLKYMDVDITGADLTKLRQRLKSMGLEGRLALRFSSNGRVYQFGAQIVMGSGNAEIHSVFAPPATAQWHELGSL